MGCDRDHDYAEYTVGGIINRSILIYNMDNNMDNNIDLNIKINAL